MSDTVEIRLFGGPLDGEYVEVPSDYISRQRRYEGIQRIRDQEPPDAPTLERVLYEPREYVSETMNRYVAFIHTDADPREFEDEVLRYAFDGVFHVRS